MTRPRCSLILLTAFAAILVGGCGGKESPDAYVFKIIATGNVRGEIEPCGCRPPLGGLARKATYVRGLAKSGEPYLVVDAGDLFFSKAQLAGADLAKEKIRALTLVQGFNRIGTDAVAIGEYDLAAGLPFLMALADSARFPFLSANLTDLQGNLILAPYVIVNKGNLRIGLIGATSAMMSGVGYRTAALLPALEGVVEELKSRVDVLVLLFHGADSDRLIFMASGLPIDLILQSHVSRFDPNLGRGAIPTASLGTQGKYLNVITATIRTPGEALTDLSSHRRNLAFMESSLKRLRRNQPKDVPLEELYAENPRALERIRNIQERGDLARRAIAAATNTLETRSISLGASITNDQDLLSLVTLAKQAIEELPETSLPSRADATSL